MRRRHVLRRMRQHERQHGSTEHPRDRGSVTLLSIAFSGLALLLVIAVVSATGVHLEHKRLVALADVLALDAADALDFPSFYRGDAPRPTGTAAVPLTDRAVRQAVDAYLAEHPGTAADLEGLRVVEAATNDGRTARVSLAALARPPLLSWVTAPWSDGVPLSATSSARAW